MPYNRPRPEDRAGATRSASSAAASVFYDENQSVQYTTRANAAIQKDLTRHALELLRFGTTTAHAQLQQTVTADETEEPWLLLDLGAGSGLSTLAANEWLLERGLLGFTLAFDISASMLSLTAADTTSATDEDAAHTAQYNTLCMQRTGFYRANAAQQFPLRSSVFHAAIGISMLQWLTREGLETCFASLHQQLSNSRQGRAVFQVYPPTIEYVELMEQTAKLMGFSYAEVFVTFPHATTAKKWYFCIEAAGKMTSGNSTSSSGPAAQSEDCHQAIEPSTPLCLFGRRFNRRCAWYLLQSQTAPAAAVLRERLGREHVKTAWHIWRKFRRSLVLAKVPAPTNVHAKRSLALYKSDEVIGSALQRRFLPNEDDDDEAAAKAVTYDLFLSHMHDVVDIFHTVCLDLRISRSTSTVVSGLIRFLDRLCPGVHCDRGDRASAGAAVRIRGIKEPAGASSNLHQSMVPMESDSSFPSTYAPLSRCSFNSLNICVPAQDWRYIVCHLQRVREEPLGTKAPLRDWSLSASAARQIDVDAVSRS